MQRGLLLTLLLAAACGGTAQRPFERVHFPASDGVLLDGRLFGRGSVGIVLAHMGREGDTQTDWRALAERFAHDGYLVLTYNRRGVCPGGEAGCSRGVDDYADSWKDVVGAVELLRGKGAETVAVIGASIGAMSSLYAASEGHIHPAALVEFGGINHASGYDFTHGQIERIGGSKLFLSSRDDIYGGGEAAREWYGWASEPKRLDLVPGSEHGTDLLRAGNPQRGHVEDLITSFVEAATRSER